MTLTLDARTTAFVSIDLQNGILAMPLAPYSAEQVVRHGVALGRRIAEAGGTIVLVHVGFSAGSADRLKLPVDATMTPPAGGLPADWSEFTPPVAELTPDVVITKRQWSAFHGTELDLQLRRRGIATIVLCGVSTNFGVESTAREAWQHNYAVVIAEDACTSAAADMHRFSIEKILPRISRVRSTAEILAALG